MVASQAALTPKLNEAGYTVYSKQVPLFPGSTDMCNVIDPGPTAESNPGKTIRDLTDWMRTEQINDPGHTNNKANSRIAAGAMSDACRPG